MLRLQQCEPQFGNSTGFQQFGHPPSKGSLSTARGMPTAIRPKPKRNCLHRGTNYVFPKRSQDVEDQTDDQQSEELSEPISSKRQLKRKSTYKKRTSRVTFTDEQNLLLLAVFNENPYPSIDQRKKLADENNLTESQVFPIKSRLRFQLFRSKLRRKLRCFNFNKTTMRSELRKNR
ncbi:Protein CBG11788 [Caenorhabditis briggsae]|uniref:Protein CBG11788 n=1 Tax=Caenorhabditis briggsae TaxID=6238 RepID=A8XE19_CAEBR|nr:Protein CBG11788 [Caenorhabditis briggsae]CAP30889.2 Protein CBG11788 [Caenorhabditis briggsae]